MNKYVYIYMWMYVCDHVCTYIDSYVCSCPLYTWMCQEVAEENQRHSAAVRIQSFVSCRDLAVFPQPGWVPNGARPGRSGRSVMFGKHDSA